MVVILEYDEDNVLSDPSYIEECTYILSLMLVVLNTLNNWIFYYYVTCIRIPCDLQWNLGRV